MRDAPPTPDHLSVTGITPAETARAVQVLRFDRVQPDREWIARLVQLTPGRDSHARWFERLDQLLGDLAPLMRPRGVFRIDEVIALDRQRIALDSGATYRGTLGAHLKPARFVATFVVTIGSAIERLSRGWLRAGQVMSGTVADAIASEAVEATAARLRDEVRVWARAHGLEATPAYSPGYCGLSIREQITVFASLPAHRINVRLTSTCLMVPIKSISGLIGIGPPDQVDPESYPCEACDQANCVQRRAPFRQPPE